MSILLHLILVLFSIKHYVVGNVKTSLCRCEKYAYDNRPFVGVWNSPTIGCDFNFSTPISLKPFGIYENDKQTWNGKSVTLFSAAQLGLYPYFVSNGQGNYNGGLPQLKDCFSSKYVPQEKGIIQDADVKVQLIDLRQHLQKARSDILTKIPDPNFHGLAVIDWEAWRPIWDTNWNSKRVYKVRSVELVRSQHPNWSLKKLIEEAKQQFESSARAMFEQTITLGKELRPKALWGFYGFPDCFANQENRYQCTPEVRKFNDRLSWLYSSSTALYPSMYLLEEHPDNRDYVLGRLRETLRFATKGFGKTKRNLPIFAYHRNIYENYPAAFNFLTKKDLDNTVGLAADIGASGVVFWGNRYDENTSPEVCEQINNYVAKTLGPYLKNKAKQVESCSTAKCGHRGHCVQRSVLTPDVERRYEDLQRLDTCGGPVSLLHDGNVLLQKKSQIPEFPLANTLNTLDNIHNTSQPLTNFNGFTDLGAQHPKTPDFETMNKFFNQVNGSAKHTTEKFTNNSKPSFQVRNATHPQLKHPGNITRQNNITHHPANVTHQLTNVNKTAPHHPVNASHQPINTTHHQGNITHPKMNQIHGNMSTKHLTGNKTTNLQINKSLMKTSNTKKSSIPHPPIDQHHVKNLTVMDQKKSHLVHQLLSSVRGSLITTPEFLKKHNLTNQHHNNSRKSNIEKIKDGNSPNMASKHNKKSWLPHMYVILIGVSLGGALMFSLIFVAVYYYISLRETFPSKYGEGKLFKEDDKTDKNIQPQAHSSPKGCDIPPRDTDVKETRKERLFTSRGKKNDNNEIFEKKIENTSETNEKRRRHRSVERSSNVTQKNTSEEEQTQEKKPRRSTTPSNTSRSYIPRPKSVEKKNSTKETRQTRSLSRERRSELPQRSRSLKRERFIQPRQVASDDEVSEYEVNLNELR